MLGLTAGALVSAACANTRTDTDEPGPSASTSPKPLSVALATIELAVGDSRLAFALFDGELPFAPAGTQVSLIPPDGDAITLEPSTETIERGTGGDSTPTSVDEIFVVTHRFTEPGFWTLEAKFTQDGVKRDALTTFKVIEDSNAPMVGEKAIEVETATFDKPLGVNPICTREPACSMHQMTIADAVTSGAPTVITFATPKFCTSRTCGPAVDIVEAVIEDFPDVNFVHIEVWNDETVSELAPGMKEWGFDGEPWIIFVDAEGVVRARWSGALGTNEFVRAIADLSNGRL